MKNKYLEMYYKDTVIKEHKKLYSQIEKQVEDIREIIYDIGVSFQTISRDLIKSKRIFYLEKKETDFGYYKAEQDYALGNYGFGSKRSTWASNLEYNWRCIFNTKKEIIKNKDKIIKGIKNLYVRRFEKLLKALELFPEFEDKLKTYTDNFLNLSNKEFYENESFSMGYIDSELMRHYGNNISTLLITKKEKKNISIEPDDIEDMFLYNHLYDKFNVAMKEHINKLKHIQKLLDEFISRDEYKGILQEAINIRLLQNI